MKTMQKRLMSLGLAVVMACALLPANMAPAVYAAAENETDGRAVDNRPYNEEDDTETVLDETDPDDNEEDDPVDDDIPTGDEPTDGDDEDDDVHITPPVDDGDVPIDDDIAPPFDDDETDLDPPAADELAISIGETIPSPENFTGLAAQYGPNGKFLAPISAPAAGSVGISTRAQLEAIKNNLNGKYHLLNDIDLSGSNWVPIGSDYSSKFTGTFDGQGHIIKNLKTSGDLRYAGLFGWTDGATIKNVGIEGTNIDVSYTEDYEVYAGGICGLSYSGTIINCYNTGYMSAFSASSHASVGGICGNIFLGSIEDCYNTSDVYASTSATYYGGACGGGICGSGTVDISDCYNAGSVSAVSTVAISSGGYHAVAGGICGSNQDNIHNCYNVGFVSSSTVSGEACAGGICGSYYNNADEDVLSNCYNTAAVSATSSGADSVGAHAGGVCGTSQQVGAPTVSNCYNTGDVSVYATNSSYRNAGGICGSGLVSNCYWNIDSKQTVNGKDRANSAKRRVGNTSGSTGSLTTAKMKQKSSYGGFNFNTVWDINAAVNNGYPFLRSLPSEGSPAPGTDYKYFEAKIDGFTYSDKYFGYDPTDYSDNLHKFATFAAKLSVDAYGEDEVYNEDVIKNTYRQMKFDEYFSKNYPADEEERDTVGYTFALKKNIPFNGVPYNLIVVTVRGTPPTDEWYGNFDIGFGDIHHGFLLAEAQLHTDLRAFMNTHKLTDKTKNKIMITGHSRGAAVANLLAASWNSSQSFCLRNNLFAFTFATPNVVKKGQINNSIHRNIYNFVNAEDFVPYLPLVAPGWDFWKYGTTKVFPGSGIGTSTAKLRGTFQSAYKRLTGKDYTGFKGYGTTSHIVLGMYDLAKNVNDYYNKKHAAGTLSGNLTPKEYFDIVAEAKADGGIFDKLDILTTKEKYGFLTDYFVMPADPLPKVDPRVGESHSSKLYLAWMNAIGDEKAISSMLSSVYVWGTANLGAQGNYARIACPVDVEVYDSQGVLVARIVDNVIDETLDNGIGIFYDEYDEVTDVYFPAGDTYTLKIIGNGNGTMEYTAGAFDIATGATEEEKEFVEVAVYNGKEMTSTVVENVPDTALYLLNEAGEEVVEILADGRQRLNSSSIQLDKSYLVLPTNQSSAGWLVAKNDKSTDVGAYLKWESDNEAIAAIDQSGQVSTGSLAGRATVRAYDEVGGLAAECRLDVIDQPLAEAVGPEAVRFLQTAATSNALSTNYARVPIQLGLEQNLQHAPGLSSEYNAVNGAPAPNSISAAVFENEDARKYYNIEVIDDRWVELRPTPALKTATNVKSLTSKMTVTFADGSETKRTTTNDLKISVSRAEPTFKAAALAFNSFFPEAAFAVSVTPSIGKVKEVTLQSGSGVTKTEAGGALSLRLIDKNSRPQNLVLAVKVDEFPDKTYTVRLPATVKLTAPKPRLSASTVTMKEYANLRITGSDYIDFLEVEKVVVNRKTADNSLFSLSRPDADGNFAVSYEGDEGISPAATLTIAVNYHGTQEKTKLTLNIKKAPANAGVKLKSGTVTFSLKMPAADKEASVPVTFTPTDAGWGDFDIEYDAKSKAAGNVEVSALGGALEVKLADAAPKGNYKVNIVNRVTKKKTTLTVKAVEKDPSIKLAAKGAFNIIDPDSTITLTPKFANCYYDGGSSGVSLDPAKGDNKHFRIHSVSPTGVVALRMADTAGAKPRTKLTVVLTYDGRDSLPLTITPRQTKPKLQATKQISLQNNDVYSEGVVDITALNPAAARIKAVDINKNSRINGVPARQLFKIREIQNGRYAIGFADEALKDKALWDKIKKGGNLKLDVLFEGSDLPVSVTVKVVVQ